MYKDAYRDFAVVQSGELNHLIQNETPQTIWAKSRERIFAMLSVGLSTSQNGFRSGPRHISDQGQAGEFQHQVYHKNRDS